MTYPDALLIHQADAEVERRQRARVLWHYDRGEWNPQRLASLSGAELEDVCGWLCRYRGWNR